MDVNMTSTLVKTGIEKFRMILKRALQLSVIKANPCKMGH